EARLRLLACCAQADRGRVSRAFVRERERERAASSKKSRQFQKSGGKCLRRACRWDLFTCERTTISRVVDVRLSALSRCTQRYSVNRVFRAAVVVAAVVVFAGPTAAADPS